MQIWLKYPAFFYATAILGGIAHYHGFPYLLLLALTSERVVRHVGYLLLYFTSLGTYFISQPPPAPQENVFGKGYFELHSIRANSLHGKSSLQYQGVLKGFATEHHIYEEIPISIRVERAPPEAGCYIVEGVLRTTSRGTFYMKEASWTPLGGGKSFTHLRFALKNRLRSYLKKHIADEEVYGLFASLGTGEIETPTLGIQFNRLGLRHTLAISGFHYSYILFIFGLLLRLVFSKRLSAALLILLTTFYFLFIGETPSLNRAWIAALVYLLGILIHRTSFGLNALGVALIASLILDPNSLFHIGFQLSYAATFAIFTFYPFVERQLRLLLPKRSHKEALELSRLSQHGYILTSLIRQSAALTISVNVFCFPLILYHFQAFPLVSLLCNLFFPPMLAIAMILLLLGVLLPYIGPLFLHIATWYMGGTLSMVLYGMGRLKKFTIYGHLEPLPVSLLIVALSLLGLYLEEKRYQLTRLESLV